MKQLFEIDLHDYDESDTVFRRPSARAIIFDDVGKIALVYSKKENYYKPVLSSVRHWPVCPVFL